MVCSSGCQIFSNVNLIWLNLLSYLIIFEYGLYSIKCLFFFLYIIPLNKLLKSDIFTIKLKVTIDSYNIIFFNL